MTIGKRLTDQITHDALVFMALSDRGQSHLQEASEIENWIERKMTRSDLNKSGRTNYRAVLRALERLLKKRLIKSRGRNQQCATLWYSRERIKF